MRGKDDRHDGLFSYVRPDSWIPQDHPLRAIRRIADAALISLSPEFDTLYAREGRPISGETLTFGTPPTLSSH